MGNKSAFFGQNQSVVYLAGNICSTSYFNSDVAGEMWRGLLGYRPQLGCDLLAVACSLLWNGHPSMAHSLIHPDSADGFLTWREDTDKAPFSAFKHKPVVCLSIPHGDFPLVAIPNRQGMLELFRHLAGTHGFRKIAFVGAKKFHPSAQERLMGYLAGLDKFGIEADPKLLITDGSWEFDWGIEAVHILLDERGLAPGVDIDVIMCAADQVALGVVSELLLRGYEVPGQIAVTGYNHSPAVWNQSPLLTTVAQPLQRQSRKAFSCLGKLTGFTPDIEFDDELQPSLMIGQSCGCREESYGWLTQEQLVDPQAMLTWHLHQWLPSEPARVEAFRIMESLKAALAGEIDPVETLDLISQHNRHGRRGEEDRAFWQVFFACCRTHSVQNTDLKQFFQTEGILNLISKRLTAIQCQSQRRDIAKENQIQGLLFRADTDFVLATTRQAMLGLIPPLLERMGIPGCWIVFYEEPANESIPETGRLVLAMEDGKLHSIPDSGLAFKLFDIVPSGFRLNMQTDAFALFPLCFGPLEYGYVIFGNTSSFPYYSALANTIAKGMHNK